MASFRNINYGRTLYEALRNYYSVNAKTGELTSLYRYLAAIIQPLQPRFDAYVIFRVRQALIASTKWQIGQLTNVLNYLYDVTLKRIFITQATLTVIADPIFEYAPVNFDSDFDSEPLIQERQFGDGASTTVVTINVPESIDQADLLATIEQIHIEGIPYEITTFP